MTPNRRIRRALQALAVFASLSGGLACAEDKYPSSPIRLVVPFNTGGSTDLIAQHAGAHLGQPIVIENRGGVGGSLGTPPVIVNRLNQAVHRAMASPEFQRKLKEMGGTPMQNTPDHSMHR